MLALAADHNGFSAATGQRLSQGLLGVEAIAPLIKYHLFQVGTEPHLTGIRGKHAGQQVEQRGLAGAVRADNADPVGPHDPHRKISHDPVIAISFGDALRRRDEPAGQIGLYRVETGRRGRGAVLPVLAAQRV
jgi:hypothetical protein